MLVFGANPKNHFRKALKMVSAPATKKVFHSHHFLLAGSTVHVIGIVSLSFRTASAAQGQPLERLFASANTNPLHQ
jgi:hypothetical protein